MRYINIRLTCLLTIATPTEKLFCNSDAYNLLYSYIDKIECLYLRLLPINLASLLSVTTYDTYAE